MPLSQQDQFSLLKDILTNQQTDCCGSVAECEQVERLVKSLMINMDIDQSALTILEEIYRYGQTGAGTADLDTHISEHQGQLSEWVDEIDQYS